MPDWYSHDIAEEWLIRKTWKYRWFWSWAYENTWLQDTLPDFTFSHSI